MNKFFLIFILSGCFFISANAQQNKQAQLDSLFSAANRLGLFNGNVLVESNKNVIYMKSFGSADFSGNTPLTDAYRFNIGSIAKEFNAVAIIMLLEENKLDLTDKVSKFIPELPAWADKISVMNLLQYTSGVPDSKWKETKGDAHNLANLKLITTLDFEPGTKYAYNNNNTFLQRQIIERVSGLTFNEFVYTKMLRPLGIRNAIIDPSDKDPLIARSFNNQKVQDDLTPPISGWTSLNVNDFLTWSHALNSFKLISPVATKILTVPFSPGNQTGLGRGLIENNKLVAHVHDGSARNYQALLISSPVFTIILQTNNQQNNLYPISRSVQNILEGKPYARIRKALLSTFSAEISGMTGAQLIAFYEQLKLKSPGVYAFDSEDMLNEVGYAFMRQNKLDDAILVFQYNVKLFPESANLFDSLGEAYYKKGDKAKSLEAYKRALVLDPNLDSAKQMVKTIEKEM